MATEKLRVGIIGIGIWSTMSHVPALLQTGRVELVSICRRSSDKLAFSRKQLGAAKAYTDWQELLAQDQLDAVVISTPHHMHAKQAVAALERGLHVLVEKPMALTGQDAQHMNEAAKRANRILMVGYNRRFHGLWRTAKQMLAENAIGPIRQVNIQWSLNRRSWAMQEIPDAVLAGAKRATQWPDEFFDGFIQGTDWHGSPTENGGGMFANSGTHWVDLVLWLASAPAIEVVALQDSLGMPAECFLNVQARLTNEVQLSMTSADVPAGGWGGQGQLAVIGEEGILTHDLAKAGEIWLQKSSEITQLESTLPDTTPAAGFVSVILDGTENLVPGEEAIAAVEFMEATYRSAAEGRIVQIAGRSVERSRKSK